MFNLYSFFNDGLTCEPMCYQDDCVTIRRIGLFDKTIINNLKSLLICVKFFLRIKWFGALANVKIGGADDRLSSRSNS
jgi:hypothetical protein